MNKNILNTHVQEFINAHLNQDITKTILSGSPFAEVAIAEIADQIAAKKSAKVSCRCGFKRLIFIFRHPYLSNKPPLKLLLDTKPDCFRRAPWQTSQAVWV